MELGPELMGSIERSFDPLKTENHEHPFDVKGKIERVFAPGTSMGLQCSTHVRSICLSQPTNPERR